MEPNAEKKTAVGANNRDVLDLSRVVVRTEHELKRLMEKVPDFKIRPEKIIGQTSSFDSTDFGNHDDATTTDQSYPFADPVPASMREVDLRELGRVDISWRMLTTARPKNRTEEDIFTRFVHLEKLQYETVKWENDEETLREQRGRGIGAAGRSGGIPRGRSRGGALMSSGGGATRGGQSSRGTAVTEIRLQTCRECGEEFCAGTTCKKYLYDDHARTLNPPSVDDIFKVVTVHRSRTSHAGGSSNSKAPASKSGTAVTPAAVGAQQVPVLANSKTSKSLDLDLVVSGQTKQTTVKDTTGSRSKSQHVSKKLGISQRATVAGSRLRGTALVDTSSAAVVDGSATGNDGNLIKTTVATADRERNGAVHKLKHGHGTKRR